MDAPRSQRHAQVSELFLAALDLPASLRAGFVQSSCGADEALREEVDSLLRHHGGGDSFLHSPATWSELAGSSDGAAVHRLPELGSARAVEGFEIERVLGWGGMSVVYLARQLAFDRRVALKVLRTERNFGSARARFLREADVPARVSHPAIVEVYGAGESPHPLGSLPWIAMEWVRGAPITEAANERNLDLRGRVAWIAEACDGVQAAHDAGVVHRDLKPANLLVDERGAVRVLDFGIASTRAWLEARAEHPTLAGQVLGTLAYMSPEQAAGRAHEVQPACDVYALGAILFELVSGALPHEIDGLPAHVAARRIADGDARALRDACEHAPRDLELVVSKALSVEPERRYPAAGALGQDLRRWLDGRPVAARPPSATYVLRKLVHRHPGFFSATVASVAFLSVGLVVTVSSLEHVRAEQSEAARQRDAFERTADFLALRQLVARVDELWPRTPQQAPRMRAWLEDVRARCGRLSRMDAAAGPFSPADVSECLRSAIDPVTGAFAEVERHLRLAEDLERATLVDFSPAWEEAVRSIADARESPRYGGLRIDAQVGLIPLGRDPDSGLWEFAVHDANLSAPQRDPATGRLIIDECSAPVLILLPGGTFLMGGQESDPAGPNYDPESRDHETGPREVSLDPFFISKFELTQFQYASVMGSNPSLIQPGLRTWGGWTTGQNPVEFIDFEEASRVCQRLNLELPTEAQWEYAARAGTTTACWTGADVEVLIGIENLTRPGTTPDPAKNRPWAVGRSAANPFGLHDVAGNVSEWCRDPYKVDYFKQALRARDGLVLASSPDNDRTRRGGSFSEPSHLARSAFRCDAHEKLRAFVLGVRPVRAVAQRTSTAEGTP